MNWKDLLPEIIADRAWCNGWLHHLAEAIKNEEDPRPYIDAKWLEWKGLNDLPERRMR
jgi:hypothetical protein